MDKLLQTILGDATLNKSNIFSRALIFAAPYQFDELIPNYLEK